MFFRHIKQGIDFCAAIQGDGHRQAAKHFMGIMQAVIPKANNPMAAFRNGLDAAFRIFPCSERCVEISRWVVIAGEGIRIVLDVQRCIRNQLPMVGGGEANFTRNGDEFGRGGATGWQQGE